MAKLFWEDFQLGHFGDFGPRSVTREEIIAFATEFDPQPMHLDEAAARKSMLGGLAASGWNTCALMMRIITDGFINKSASMGGPGVDNMKWLKPVRPGDQIRVRGTVTEKWASRSRPKLGFVRFFYEGFNQNDELVLTMNTMHMVERRGDGQNTPDNATASNGLGA